MRTGVRVVLAAAALAGLTASAAETLCAWVKLDWGNGKR